MSPTSVIILQEIYRTDRHCFGRALYPVWTKSLGLLRTRYNRNPETNFPGTHGELARHLLDRFDLHDVKVVVMSLEITTARSTDRSH